MWRFSFFVLSAVAVSNAIIPGPPVITKQSATRELFFEATSHGIPLVLDCEADEARPRPQFTWFKDGKLFEPNDFYGITKQPLTGTLVFTWPREENSGEYQCFAKNEHGTASSNPVLVKNVEFEDFRDTTTKIVEVEEGPSLKLKCRPPAGIPQPEVFWVLQRSNGVSKRINNTRMTVDPEGNLWFSNVTRLDDSENLFYYVCTASSIFKQQKFGNKILLRVSPSGSEASNNYQPTEQYVSRDQIALRGQKIEIFCIYAGTPLPEMVWSKNGSPVVLSERVKLGNFGKSLIIEEVELSDKGEYTCEASNEHGHKNSTINIDVKSAPYFTKKPESKVADGGESVEFKCEASGIPEPVIEWTYNGMDIANAPNNPKRVISNNEIAISNLKESDTGNFGCKATNEFGQVYHDFYLQVLSFPPGIDLPPLKIIKNIVGSQATLICRMVGSPKPKITWLFDEAELTGERFKIQDSGDLVIEKIKHSDAGVYTCNAENIYGTRDVDGSLEVFDPTKITEIPQDTNVTVGSQATFHCKAIGDPRLEVKIKWLHKDEEINFSSQSRFNKSDDNSLKISNIVEQDSGKYTCLAATKLDETSANVTLAVRDAI